MTQHDNVSRRSLPAWAAALFATALAALPAEVRASTGGDELSDVFNSTWGPVRPIGDLATGSLGVVERTWWRRPLLLAWFRFNEIPFPKAAADAFTYRELGTMDDTHLAVVAWRQAVRTAAPDLEPAREPSPDSDLPRATWGSYENCPAAAWDQARATLAARSQAWGTQSAALRDWIVAQHRVFARCRLGPRYFRSDLPEELRLREEVVRRSVLPEMALPDPPPGAPPLLGKDRDYQRASAFLYEGHYADAERAFAAIARDKQSPWQEWGNYLALRARLRELQVLPAALTPPDRASTLRHDLEAALADAKRRNAGAEIARLEALNALVSARLDPAARYRELAAALSRPRSDARAFGVDVIDYLHLQRQLSPGEPIGEWLAGVIGARDPASRSCGGKDLVGGAGVPTLAETSCLRVQLSQNALQRYRQRPKERAWLFTAAALAERTDPHRDALLRALAEVPEAHPGSTSFLLHRLRLASREQGGSLGKVLLARPEVAADYSARNRVRQYRLLSAASIEEFWMDALRDAGGRQDFDTLLKGPAVPEREPAWDVDGAWILDYELPHSALLATATRSAWPESLRRQVAVMVWARAVLRGDSRLAREALALPILVRGLPAEESARLRSLTDDTVFLMESKFALWSYGVSPLVGGAWCRLQPPAADSPRNEWRSGRDDPSGQFGEAAARLLPADALERWRQERKVLDALPPRTNLLMQNTLDFAARFPSDPRAPALLRETVYATRLDTCGDPSAAALSKQAFNLLKRNYAKSKEARQTKYWFKPGY